MRSIIYHDQFIIHANIDTVAGFITNPARILDYYPAAWQQQTFMPQQSFACYGLLSASLIEVEAHQRQTIRLKVYNSLPSWCKRDANSLKKQTFFTMLEDWKLQTSENSNQTIIDKTWYQLEQPRWAWIPDHWIKTVIKLTAKHERKQLIKAWNKAAYLEKNQELR